MEPTSSIALMLFLTLAPSITARSDAAAQLPWLPHPSVRESQWVQRIRAPRPAAAEESPITVRPFMLAQQVSVFAGHHVRVWQAKVVGVFDPRVFLVETATRFRDPIGFRDRVLVMVDPGALRVPATLLVGSTVTVFGVARTLLGMQVSHEVPWPTMLDPKLVEQLEIHAAVLARSVQTPEGIELTDGGASQRQFTTRLKR